MSKAFTFQAPAKEITGVVSRVTRTSRGAVSILNGVHMSLDGEGLVVQTSDMSLILRERIPVTHAGEGTRVVLDATRVLKGLRTLDGTLTFTGKEDTLAITNGSTTLKYVVGQVEDYPRLPEGMGGGLAVTCPRKEFELTFDTVKAAISKDASRPVLTGVFLEMDGDRVRMTTTDSYRLASDSCSATKNDFGEALVNGADFKKALAFISQGIPPAKNGNISLSRFDKWVVLSEGNNERSAWLRIIEGQFPKYRQLVPETFEGYIELDRRASLKAFDRMAKLNEGNRPAKIDWAEDGVVTTLGTYGDEKVNLVESKIEATVTGTYAAPCGVNPAYMYDALEAIGGDKARFHFISPIRPFVLSETDWVHTRGGIPDRFYLIMPIRLAS